MTRELLSGNEAIATGAREAGCSLGVGYPGTPSTETLETLATFGDVHCEWAPNEKVALEVGVGSAMGGARTLVTMKHVGVNVAADPLMSVCNTGVNGGLVVLAADDPSIYSSQNEQDSRNWAAFARVPMLEPADSAEAREFAKLAFELSERYDTPVMIRETVRIAHTKSLVELDGSAGPGDQTPRDFECDIAKYVMMPANAKRRRLFVDERTRELTAFAESSDLDRIEMRGTEIGVICSGADYQHVREALPDASVLKLGLSWPLPPEKISKFAAAVEKCYVVEEACDYFDLRVRAIGVELATPPAGPLPPDGEMTPARIRTAFGIDEPPHVDPADDLPPRPPALCPGCPHRLVYCELRRLKAVVTGDIGCYTLGAVPPLGAVHSTVDMGASLAMAHGMELARVTERTGRPVVGVIGDSTFAHSGIESLLGTVYNSGVGTLCILDNRTTAMTGCQGNPANGVTLMEQARRVSPLDVPPDRPLDLVALVRAMGVDDVVKVDSQNLKAVREALESAVAATDRLSVIVFASPCRLVLREKKPAPMIEGCRKCRQCIQIGCPAIRPDAEGYATIDSSQCIGCGQCVQVCPFGCITEGAAAGEAAGGEGGAR